MKKRLAVGIVGDITAVLLLAAPGLTFRIIVKAKDVQERTCYPYLGTLLNCVCWVVYGLPQKHWVVVGVNGLGIGVEALYCAMYIAYSTGKRRSVAIFLLIAEAIIAAILFAILYTVFLHGKYSDARDVTFGVLGAVTGTVMYVSPVMDMVNAIKTKDTSSMSLPLAICSFANGVTWTVYALIDPIDWYILVPNMLGILCAAVQIVTFILASLKLCCFKQQQ